MSFQSDIGNESYLFFEKLRCMSLLMPFGPVNEAEKMINFASMIITPKKQFTIEKGRVEFLVGNDTSKYTGFAFGLGLNRLAMIYYGLTEIRKFYENDISLWNQL